MKLVTSVFSFSLLGGVDSDIGEKSQTDGDNDIADTGEGVEGSKGGSSGDGDDGS